MLGEFPVSIQLHGDFVAPLGRHLEEICDPVRHRPLFRRQRPDDFLKVLRRQCHRPERFVDPHLLHGIRWADTAAQDMPSRLVTLRQLIQAHDLRRGQGYGPTPNLEGMLFRLRAAPGIGVDPLQQPLHVRDSLRRVLDFPVESPAQRLVYLPVCRLAQLLEVARRVHHIVVYQPFPEAEQAGILLGFLTHQVHVDTLSHLFRRACPFPGDQGVRVRQHTFQRRHHMSQLPELRPGHVLDPHPFGVLDEVGHVRDQVGVSAVKYRLRLFKGPAFAFQDGIHLIKQLLHRHGPHGGLAFAVQPVGTKIDGVYELRHSFPERLRHMLLVGGMGQPSPKLHRVTDDPGLIPAHQGAFPPLIGGSLPLLTHLFHLCRQAQTVFILQILPFLALLLDKCLFLGLVPFPDRLNAVFVLGPELGELSLFLVREGVDFRKVEVFLIHPHGQVIGGLRRVHPIGVDIRRPYRPQRIRHHLGLVLDGGVGGKELRPTPADLRPQAIEARAVVRQTEPAEMFLPEPLVIHPRPDILIQGYGRLAEIFPHVPVLLVQRRIQGGGFPQDAVRNFYRYVHGLVKIGVRIVGNIRKQGVQVFHQGSLVVGTAGFLQDGIGQFPDAGGFYLVPLCQLELPAQGLHLFPERLVFFRQ